MRMSDRYSRRSTLALIVGVIALILSLYNFYLIVFKVVRSVSYLD